MQSRIDETPAYTAYEDMHSIYDELPFDTAATAAVIGTAAVIAGGVAGTVTVTVTVIALGLWSSLPPLIFVSFSLWLHCVCSCVYVRVYARVYVCMYASVYVCACVRARTCVHVYWLMYFFPKLLNLRSYLYWFARLQVVTNMDTRMATSQTYSLHIDHIWYICIFDMYIYMNKYGHMAAAVGTWGARRALHMKDGWCVREVSDLYETWLIHMGRDLLVRTWLVRDWFMAYSYGTWLIHIHSCHMYSACPQSCHIMCRVYICLLCRSLMYVRDVTDSYETWLVRMGHDSLIQDMTDSYETWRVQMRHDAFRWDMTHSYETGRIHMRHESFYWDMTHSHGAWCETELIHTRHDSFIRCTTQLYGTWLTYMGHDLFVWGMTHSQETRLERSRWQSLHTPSCHVRPTLPHPFSLPATATTYFILQHTAIIVIIRWSWWWGVRGSSPWPLAG